MEKKDKLREYHENLSARVSEVEGAAGVSSRMAFLVGQAPWLVNMEDVSEVMPLPDLTPVPLTRPWYLGVTNVRGNLHGVADFPAFLGEAFTPPGSERRVLLIHPRHGVNCGLLVNAILGLRRDGQLEAVPESGAFPPYVRARWTDGEGRVFDELHMGHLVCAREFLEIGLFKRRSVFTKTAQESA